MRGVGDDGDRPELDPIDRLPRLLLPLGKVHAMKAGSLELGQKIVFTPGAGDTTGPELGIGLQMRRHVFVRDDVADRGSTTSLEDSKNLAEQLLSIFWPHQIEDTVGDNAVDTLPGNQRLFATQTLFDKPLLEDGVDAGLVAALHLTGQQFQVELQS